jgi:hypothetical protein
MKERMRLKRKDGLYTAEKIERHRIKCLEILESMSDLTRGRWAFTLMDDKVLALGDKKFEKFLETVY